MRITVVPIAAALVCLGLAAPAAAAPSTAADQLTCQISAELAFAPPLGEEPQDSTASTTADTLTCTGTVAGEEVDPGAAASLAVTASLPGATCYASTGSGTFTVTVTTRSGAVQSVSGAVDFAVAGFQIDATGDLTGTGSITPTDGDCIEAPISAVTADIADAVITVAAV